MSNGEVLVLHRRTRTPAAEALHCREIELRLDQDAGYIVLSRYVELYSEEASTCRRVRHHRIPIARLLRWMIRHGLSVEE